MQAHVKMLVLQDYAVAKRSSLFKRTNVTSSHLQLDCVADAAASRQQTAEDPTADASTTLEGVLR